jgi:hypothetical protein
MEVANTLAYYDMAKSFIVKSSTEEASPEAAQQ